MEWMQCLTIIGSFAGLIFYLDKSHREDMKSHRAELKEELKEIRKEIGVIDSKWEKLFGLFIELKLKQDSYD